MTMSNDRAVSHLASKWLVTTGALLVASSALALAPTQRKSGLVAQSAASSSQTAPLPVAKPSEARQLDWDELLPPNERDNFDTESPAPDHGYLGEDGPAASQQGSFNVNVALNKAHVKIPGFVVPLNILPTGLVREFFLVPYYGACIHVPPPPPNQIVYVKMARPIKVASMYDAVWITGTLRAEKKMSRFGAAAYTLDGQSMEIYEY